MKVFISYDTKDTRFVAHLVQELKAVGINTLIANLQIQLGENSIFEELDRGTQHADHVIVVLSQSFLNDAWLMTELTACFVKEKFIRKPGYIIPILLEECQPPHYLLNREPINFGIIPFEEAFLQLKELLSGPQQLFVVMKFGDPALDSAFWGVISPLAQTFEYQVVRVDQIQNSGLITDQILHEIEKSEIVLVDLTGERPNCYYEAGFAQALGKELIFTARTNTHLHFDLAGYRFILWNTEAKLREELEKRFKAIRGGI